MQGTGTDARSDLYALGATLYHLLTARPPPDGLSRAARLQAGEPDPLRPADQAQPGVPAALAAVLGGAMALHREQRPASAAVLRDALREAAALTPLAAAPRPLPTPALPRPGQPAVRTLAGEASPSALSAPAPGRRWAPRPATALRGGQRPTGTVTFLFTDIEGSTTRWEQQPAAMRAALARHDALLRAAIEAHGGLVFKTVGDAFCAAFACADAALQLPPASPSARLHAEALGGDRPAAGADGAAHRRSRGRDGDYFGRAAQPRRPPARAGHGGQVLLSAATASWCATACRRAPACATSGEHRLKDLSRPEQIFQLVAPRPAGRLPARSRRSTLARTTCPRSPPR